MFFTKEKNEKSCKDKVQKYIIQKYHRPARKRSNAAANASSMILAASSMSFKPLFSTSTAGSPVVCNRTFILGSYGCGTLYPQNSVSRRRIKTYRSTFPNV